LSEDLKWTPLYDKLLVRRFPPDTKLGQFVVAAEAYQKQQTVGVVLRTGEGRFTSGFLQPLTVKPGWIVLFSQFSGVQLQGEDPDLLVLREDEILAWRTQENEG
jgi:chaperonin GroES